MRRIMNLRLNQRGAAVIEFALSLPILVLMIWGIFECSLLFEANAGMQHALGEGARLATLCVPNGSGCTSEADSDIKAKMNAKLFGQNDGAFTVADVVDATDSKTLSVSYTRTMDFLFFRGPTVTLTRSKLVYTPTTT
jgi:Flp pilus assembly protein TadG